MWRPLADSRDILSQSHKIEEYEKIVQDQPGELRQEKTVIVSEEAGGAKSDVRTGQVQKPSRKPIAPRFVSPVTGMIVDQGTNVVLEGIIDGEWCIIIRLIFPPASPLNLS